MLRIPGYVKMNMLRIPGYIKMNLKLSTPYDYLILLSCALFTSNHSPSANFISKLVLVFLRIYS